MKSKLLELNLNVKEFDLFVADWKLVQKSELKFEKTQLLMKSDGLYVLDESIEFVLI